MFDIAREQSPSPDQLDAMLRRSQAAGYGAVGFYLEHRFAYRSAPWAAAPGCLTPEAVGRLDRHGLRIIPFLNTLGHMEGFIRSEQGQWLAEGPATGSLQMCPSRPECVDFAVGLIGDALEAFDDEWVHLGGDETNQLGRCDRCARREPADLYADHFGRLAREVLKRGRRPALWGDMLIKHPEALDAIPGETLIFDWQYFSRPSMSTRMFRERGFDVVCCPSVQTYNSGWCFLDATRENIDQHAEDAKALGALGVMVTTWEFTNFTRYDTTLPLIYAAGRRLARGQDWTAALEAEGGKDYARAAELLGNRVPAAASFLAPGTWRQLRDRFVIRGNPFLLWRDWRDEACGAAGDEILRLCDEAAGALPFPAELHRVAVEWVRLVQKAYSHYEKPTASATALEGGEALLERLRPGLHDADAARLDGLQRRVGQVRDRLRALGDYRPSFETLIDDAYIPGDQAGWKCPG